jgi:predicted SnoaL-like aldol condensation-catalyzing enzyme
MMTSKKLVQEFYKSDAVINATVMEPFLHPDFQLEWNSSKGFVKMNRSEILAFANDLGKAYIGSKVRISHILQEGNLVSVHYSHSVKTIENPREEILLANFFAIWEVKDGKLYKGHQMSQLV